MLKWFLFILIFIFIIFVFGNLAEHPIAWVALLFVVALLTKLTKGS